MTLTSRHGEPLATQQETEVTAARAEIPILCVLCSAFDFETRAPRRTTTLFTFIGVLSWNSVIAPPDESGHGRSCWRSGAQSGPIPPHAERSIAPRYGADIGGRVAVLRGADASRGHGGHAGEIRSAGVVVEDRGLRLRARRVVAAQRAD